MIKRLLAVTFISFFVAGCSFNGPQRTQEYVFNGVNGCRINSSGYFIGDNCNKYLDNWSSYGYSSARSALMRDAMQLQSRLDGQLSNGDRISHSDQNLLPQTSSGGNHRHNNRGNWTQGEQQAVAPEYHNDDVTARDSGAERGGILCNGGLFGYWC